MPIEQLPIFCYYDRQRFIQFGAMDCANWYGVQVDSGKKKQAMYPAMGRQHVNFLNQNRLVFNQEPRAVFRTINYFYVVEGTQVFQFDRFYNRKEIGFVSLGTQLWFAFLAVGTDVYALLTDENHIFEIKESGTTVTMNAITDSNAPGGSVTGGKPLFVAAFGNRFVVSKKGTPEFYLSTINLSGGLSGCFSFGSPAVALFAQASGIIQQMAVLHNQLYIFNDFTTDIWANIPTTITVGGVSAQFPWKLNTSYNFDYGIADPNSLSVGFGRMAWLAKNQDGLVSFMTSTGQQPDDISSQAINVILEGSASGEQSPFIVNTANGFIYQYENTIFYRVSAGEFLNFGEVDLEVSAQSLEYNYETGTWARCIELNGERNRIQKHIFFNNKHLVTVLGDSAMYEMAGNIYHNELRNPAQPNAQAADAFLKYPMRYELVTQQLYAPDYSEFIDDYVEIDFVFGEQTFYKSNAPFLNTVFLVGEEPAPDGSPVYLTSEDGEFLIAEGSDTPSFDDNHYNQLFKPHIELYYSNDGGVTFNSADLREFSQLGQYRWRMRWYELGASRNRCYKLVCVSSAPIVILGGVRNSRRSSGGAN